MKLKLLSFGCFLVLAVLASHAHAQLYIRPRVGAAVKLMGGEHYYSAGGSVGYKVLDYLGAEVTYTRLFAMDSAPDGHTFRADGILQVPVGIITPFASLGLGWQNLDTPTGGSDSKMMTLIGGGLALSKFDRVSAAIGAQYAIVHDKGPDFLEPYITVGYSF